MRRIIGLCGLLALTSLASSCGHDHDHGDKKNHKHEEGPHGGELFELGTVAHVETLLDAKTGEIRIYLTGTDAKSALTIDTAPQVKMMTDSGPQVIDMSPAGGALPASEFSAKHDSLAVEHPKGRLSISVGGKSFNPDIDELHHHEDEE